MKRFDPDQQPFSDVEHGRNLVLFVGWAEDLTAKVGQVLMITRELAGQIESACWELQYQIHQAELRRQRARKAGKKGGRPKSPNPSPVAVRKRNQREREGKPATKSRKAKK